MFGNECMDVGNWPCGWFLYQFYPLILYFSSKKNWIFSLKLFVYRHHIAQSCNSWLTEIEEVAILNKFKYELSQGRVKRPFTWWLFLGLLSFVVRFCWIRKVKNKLMDHGSMEWYIWFSWKFFLVVVC